MRHTCLHPCLDARWLWTCVLKCVHVSLLVSHALAMHFGFVVRVSVSYIVQSRGHVAHVACVEFLVSLWMVPLRSHRPQPLPPVTALDVATESLPHPFSWRWGGHSMVSVPRQLPCTQPWCLDMLSAPCAPYHFHHDSDWSRS